MNSTSSSGDRIWRAACVLVVLLYVATVPRAWQCEGVDEIEYLNLARSLAHGQGYAVAGEPHVLYPPLYPAVLSVVVRVAGALAWPAMYALNACLGLAGLLTMTWWLRARCGSAGRWAAWLALLAYYPWSFSTRYLLSEQLFFLLSALTIVLVDLVLQTRSARRADAVLVAVAALLAAMTRFGAIALVAALVVAFGVRWLKTRRAADLLPVALVVLLAGGFFALWEIRAASVNPDAAESYGRWVKVVLGQASDDSSVLSRNLGEGTAHRTSLPERFVLCGLKFGQYVTSCARVPENFAPLALALFLLFMIGLVDHLARQRDSVVGWYVLLSLGMICMTSWVSSYHRYFYPLTPLLFLFLIEGVRTCGRAGRLFRVLLIATGSAGLFWTWHAGFPPCDGGSEQLYIFALCALFAIVYVAMVMIGVMKSPPALPVWGWSLLLAVYGLHSLAIAGQRFQWTLRNATPNQRNLTGVIECGRWLDRETPRDAKVAAALPRLAVVASDRDAAPALRDADFVLLAGPLRDVPAFRADAEERLRAAVAAAGLIQVFASGDARVYKGREKTD